MRAGVWQPAAGGYRLLVIVSKEGAFLVLLLGNLAFARTSFFDVEYDTWNMDPAVLGKASEIYAEGKAVVSHLVWRTGKAR